MFIWDTDSPPAAPTTSGGRPATTSGTPAPTAPTPPARHADRPHGVAERLAASTLQWTAPGDDWLCGTATSTGSSSPTSPIEHPTDGTVVGDFAAGSGGSTESRTVASRRRRYFAVFYKDDNGNWGHLASTSISYARPEGRDADPHFPGALLQPVHGAEPHARRAARIRLLQPAGPELEHAHGRDSGRERVRGEVESRRCGST